MKFDTVLQEAVVMDKYDHYSKAGWKWHPEGRLKHVKEDIQIHILNFTIEKIGDKRKIIPSYYSRKSIYKPLVKGKEHDEVYVNKKNAGIQYSQEQQKPNKRVFASFKALHDFVSEEYNNGNVWPHKLMKRFISDGWSDWERQHKKPGAAPGIDRINYFDTIASESDRLAMVVKWTMKTQKVNTMQQYCVVMDSPHMAKKVKYGESVKSNVDRAYRELHWAAEKWLKSA